MTEHIHNKVTPKPLLCNICGGPVVYTSNAIIYGREYGTGKCYYCTKCNAFVGTSKNKPDEALGILADKEIRNLRQRCHSKFDAWWFNIKNKRKRRIARIELYDRLAKELDIYREECHFGYFDAEELHKALSIIETWEAEEKEAKHEEAISPS